MTDTGCLAQVIEYTYTIHIMHVTLDKKLHTELRKAAAHTGLDAQELAYRAILLYLESLRGLTDLTEELHAWQELGGESLRLFEASLTNHA